MKNELIFIKTRRGDRTNIMANFTLMNREMFLTDLNDKGKKWRDQYRYGAIGTEVNNLKEMSLAEFEKEFTADTFTPEQVTELFRKEISLIYGEHKAKLDIIPLKKAELVRGQVYKDFSGSDYLYLGKVRRTTVYTEYKRETKIEEGYGFEWTYDGRLTNKDAQQQLVGCTILKSIKKLMNSTGASYPLESQYSINGRGWGEGAYTSTLELL